ncbi:MAG TPA: RNA polymerase sigma factor [Terriglobales bacterium]|nr:RNA polymerase sigma factor [Acidobacteriaceae bacterium]HKR33173.1 RNA polymerase sigma factor [Terriglobales bacterium]
MLLWFRRVTRECGAKGGAESDAELVARLRNQDEQAFLRLYDGHGRTVYRFLAHMTGSVSLAEELTQDVFVEILNAVCSGAIANFDSEKGTLEGYLLGIARNLARKELRRNRALVSLESVLETPEWNRLLDRLSKDNREWAGVALVMMRADVRALYRALLDLPNHYREVVVLCSLQEKSYQQAAALLGVSEGTIASRMNRARALLAAKLRKSQSEEVNT